MAAKIMRLKDVLDAVGLGKSSIYEKIGKGEFPAPVRLGPRAVGWLDCDIEQWVASRESTRGAAQ